MGKYALRRVLQAIPLLLGVAILSFALIQFLPGGPLTLLAHNPHATAAQIKQISHNLGLDQPGYVQFFKWAGGLLHGDWGTSCGWPPRAQRHRGPFAGYPPLDGHGAARLDHPGGYLWCPLGRPSL